MTERAPVKREGNTVSLIYEQLRADILGGRLAPGSSLSQLTIARSYGTSRGPVREAMQRLQQDQLVIGFANRRFNVAPFEIADLEAVLSLHLANVALAIRASVPFLLDDEVDLLDRHRREMERAVDRSKEEWEPAYRSFVLTLIKHSGDRVVSLVDGLIDNAQRYRANLLDRFPRVYAGGPEFGRVVVAARRRDGAAAAACYAAFFGQLSLRILAGSAPAHDPARLRSYIAALTAGSGP